MKNTLLFVAVVFLLAASAAAQNTQTAKDNTNAESVALGDKTVYIPQADGLVNALRTNNRVAENFKAITRPGTDLLAGYVTPNALQKAESGGQDTDLELYARLSVQSAAREKDVSNEVFAEFGNSLAKNFDTLMAPDSKTMTIASKTLHDLLEKNRGKEVSTTLSRPQNLGVIARDGDVLTLLVLTGVEVDGRQYPIVATASTIHVKNRMIALNIYRRVDSERDIDAVQDLTKKWTTAIIAANK